ncbi:MAG TPA: S49 family peptidase [Planctomycetota bacterium]|nr:S49 family peptidase [Planctomycetota bacterium]
MKEKLVVGFLAILFIASIVVAVMSTLRAPEQRGGREMPILFGGANGYAVVPLFGPIRSADEPGFGGRYGEADGVVEKLKEVGEHPQVKAIVLRVNSPGGSVAASQELYQEVFRLKQKGIPVVASVSDLCASGGYYAACGATKIIANPGSMVGSVGVIAIFPNIQGLLQDKLAIRTKVLKSGKMKDAGSPLRDMNPEEEQYFQNEIAKIYEQFFSAVKASRLSAIKEKMRDPTNLAEPPATDEQAVEKLRSLADGRVFIGTEAKDLGLIDGLGNFQDAIDEAKRLARLPADAPEISTRVQLGDILRYIGGELLSSGPSESMGETTTQALDSVTTMRLEYLYLPGGVLK